ncbi:MAG TPA: polysaccharide deacetylase family protein [Bacillota bacterium]|nr:polysaccharide deacetylase family protein [Bacillota bacterium]
MSPKKAYLTIDDGPSKDFRPKVDFLYENSIPALFFCLGENILKYEEDMVYAAQKGFIIGNHSFSHPHFSDLTLEQCEAEIKRTDESIQRIYQKSGIECPAKFFRFPYFDTGGDVHSEENETKWLKTSYERLLYKSDDKRKAIQSFLHELGYRQPNFQGLHHTWLQDHKLLDAIDVRCTFDQMEYWLGAANAPRGLNKVEAILARIDEECSEESRTFHDPETTEIILIHDHEKTTGLFYQIINRYLEKGIRFINPL